MKRPLDGFPTSWGSNRVAVARIDGPAAYVQYVAPATGGQLIAALGAAGIKTIDFAIGGVSDDGTHRVEVVQIEASSINGVTVARASMRLKWYVVATGLQVAAAADLSGQTVSVLIIGPK